jgi:hypothetical protein
MNGAESVSWSKKIEDIAGQLPGSSRAFSALEELLADSKNALIKAISINDDADYGEADCVFEAENRLAMLRLHGHTSLGDCGLREARAICALLDNRENLAKSRSENEGRAKGLATTNRSRSKAAVAKKKICKQYYAEKMVKKKLSLEAVHRQLTRDWGRLEGTQYLDCPKISSFKAYCKKK